MSSQARALLAEKNVAARVVSMPSWEIFDRQDEGYKTVISCSYLVLESGVELSNEMFHLIAVVVAASILLHSSTDVVVVRQFRGADLEVPHQGKGS